jgi:MFS family permease
VALGSISFGLLATLFAWGVVADKIGEGPVIAAGLAGVAAAIAAAALVGSFPALVALLVLAGMAGGSVTAAGGRAVLVAFDSRRGLALGIRQMAAPVGAVVSAVAIPILLSVFGLRATLFALAALCLPAAGAAFIGLASRGASGGKTGESSQHPVRDARIWRLSAGSSLLVVSQLAVLSFVVIFLRDARGLSTGEAAAVLACMQASGALGRLAAGHWADRSAGPMLPLRKLSLAIAVSLAFLASSTEAPTPLLVALLVLVGALALGWNGLSFTAVGELAPVGDSGAALGLQQTILNVAGAIAPVLFALVLGQTSWQIAFLVFGAFPLAGYIVFTSLPVNLAARVHGVPPPA